MFFRQLLHAARRGVQAQLQLFERQRGADAHYQLTIQHEARGVDGLERLYDVRKVSRERQPVLGLQEDLSSVFEGDATKPIPLRLELPAFAIGDFVDRLCLHGRIRRPYRQAQSGTSIYLTSRLGCACSRFEGWRPSAKTNILIDNRVRRSASTSRVQGT